MEENRPIGVSNCVVDVERPLDKRGSLLGRRPRTRPGGLFLPLSGFNKGSDTVLQGASRSGTRLLFEPWPQFGAKESSGKCQMGPFLAGFTGSRADIQEVSPRFVSPIGTADTGPKLRQ